VNGSFRASTFVRAFGRPADGSSWTFAFVGALGRLWEHELSAKAVLIDVMPIRMPAPEIPFWAFVFSWHSLALETHEFLKFNLHLKHMSNVLNITSFPHNKNFDLEI
jgi:hypothetical protein